MDRRLAPRLLLVQRRDELHLRRQRELAQPLKPLNLPHQRLLGGDVFAFPPGYLARRPRGVLGNEVSASPPPMANCLSEKHDQILTFTSIRVRPSSFTIGITLKGSEMASVTRYFINSNSPSGGVNEIVFLRRELARRFTHW